MFAFVFTLLFITSLSSGNTEFTVCTYNLWNVMFSWEVRMQHVAHVVSQAGCDVIVLQEVRLHSDRSASQADFLHQFMPQFPWVTTRLADHVSKPPQSYWSGWEAEGLALFSKFPVEAIKTQHLSRSYGPDTNQRITLHVPIRLNSKTTVHVIAVHFSYDRQQQCQNAAEILKYIDRNQLSNVVVAGDFNVYPDFEDAVRLFTDRDSQTPDESNRCGINLASSSLSTAAQNLQDVWDAVHKDSPGFTFSNMPTPGLTCRPDRILTSSSIRVTEAAVFGHGSAYKTKHSTGIYLHRLHRIMQASKDAFYKRVGYSCLHNCGPHGCCRCSVCIKRESLSSCYLPLCEECSARVYFYLWVFLSTISLLLILAGTAAVKILYVASHMDQSEDFLFLGFSCCLCNTLLIRQPTVTSRHYFGKLLRGIVVGRLPPAYLLLVSLSLIVLLLAIGSVVFKSSLDTAAAVMPEEYFPSDHLMVVAQLELK